MDENKDVQCVILSYSPNKLRVILYVQHLKVKTTTPMTTDLFMKWKKKKVDGKEAGLAAQRVERAKNDRMSGRELILSDASVFVDDAEAYEKYTREEEPDDTAQKVQENSSTSGQVHQQVRLLVLKMVTPRSMTTTTTI